MRIGNWPLLFTAIEFIVQNPDRHRQSDWRSECGTYRCVAGWIAYFAGYNDRPERGLRAYRAPVSLPSQKRKIPTEEAALIALNLNPDIYGCHVDQDRRSEEMELFSDSLFLGSHTMYDILSAVRDLARADGVTPPPSVIDEMLSQGVIHEWSDA